MPGPVHTIGHSTRSGDELISLLKRNDVEMLVDVRRYPGSRRYPQFNRDALETALPAAGIAYRHAPDLGGRRGGGRAEAGAVSPNGGWRNTSFRAYADHMDSPEFRAAIEALVAEAATARVAIMCSEAVPWRCHRRLIADTLVVRGVPVRHIISDAEPGDHTLNPMAVVDDEGRITYPNEAAAPSE